jgi:hypothetical protein
MILMAVAKRLVVLGLAVWGAGLAVSDSITIDGTHYRDVLIHTSPHFYFVTIPDEGRVLTVPVEEVNPATVSIVNEVQYRDALRAKYMARRGNTKPRSYSSMDETRVVADAQDTLRQAGEREFSPRAGQHEGVAAPVGVGYSPDLELAGAQSGLGLTIAQLQAALRGAGVSMEQLGTHAGHPKYFGRSGSGHVEVDAYGAEDNLVGISLILTAPDLSQLQSQLMGLADVISAVAPWAPQWYQTNQQRLLSTGVLEQTQGDVRVSVQGGQSGADVSLTIVIESVG